MHRSASRSLVSRLLRLLVSLALATAFGCGGEEDAPARQSPPTAETVSIVDANGGDALEGDTLNGGYTYDDAEDDAEATSTFRWLRDGAAIPGALGQSYQLTADDVAARIAFEVTPVAATGNSPGSAVRSAELATGTAPVVSGQARYHDVDADGEVGAGDTLVVPFDQAVSVGAASASDFWLPVPGDVLATTSITAGPAANEVTLTLDDAAQLKARQVHPASGALASNDPSGIDVAAGIAADVVESASGKDAVASTSIDVIPAFVEGAIPSWAGASKWLEAGDIDRDGDIDLVVIRASNSEIVVLRQESNGSFVIDNPGPFGTTSKNALALGDLDGDGDLDIADARFGTNRVWTQEYDEFGSYWSRTLDELGSSATQALALGDVDRDGDLDIVCANDGGNRVYRNNGAGRFTDSGQSLGADFSIAVALGDVDRDGDLDAVFGNEAGDQVWLNDGSGTFSDSGQSIGTGFTAAVELADLDRNGYLDLVTAKSTGGNKVWLNDRSGGFDDSGPAYDASVTRDVAIVDYDSDGDLDLIFANDSGAPNTVWHNSGSGFFSDSGQRLGADASRSIALADIDEDGDIDVVTANPIAGDVLFTGSLSGAWGSATFVDSGQRLGTNVTIDIELADVDRDGDLDIVEGNDGPNAVWLNGGDGTFSDSGQTLGSGSTQSVVLGDLDRDGDVDVVEGTIGADRVWWNDGAGALSDSGQSLGSESTSGVVLGDLDRDGDLDIAASTLTYQSSGINRVWRNDGAGGFSSSGQALGTANSVAAALGDVDADGDLDMVVANFGEDHVWENNGAGTFTDTGQTLGSATSLSLAIALGDLDGNGSLDIVTALGFNPSDNGNRVWDNPGGDGVYQAHWAMGSSQTEDVAVGDVDGDGDLDVASINATSQPDRIWLNTGFGTFNDSGQALGSSTGLAGILADVDRDGDLDLVVGVSDGGNEVYLNE